MEAIDNNFSIREKLPSYNWVVAVKVHGNGFNHRASLRSKFIKVMKNRRFEASSFVKEIKKNNIFLFNIKVKFNTILKGF